MALPEIKISVSNGHFQESLQNWGDTGTWTSYDGTSPTKLVDEGANWVDDEWIGYYVVFDTGGSPSGVIITDNDATSITVAGDYSAQVGKNYRIGGGVVGTMTANPSATSTIIVTGMKNKYGTAYSPVLNEFVKMKIVPDKLDGTEYTITASTAGTESSLLTISDSSSKAISATSCEIGRGASATVYPESINISGELNEPKNFNGTIVYNVVGGFDDDDDIDNAVQLGSLVRVSETTGNKTLFEGNIYESPVVIDPDQRLMSISARDRLALLDHTVIPVTTDDPSSYSFGRSTPVLQSGATGASSNNNYLQTKGYQDYTYVPRPLAISSYASSTANPYNANTSDGTWASVQATSGSSGATLVYATGGFKTGTPGTDQVEEGSVVIKLNSTPADSRVTYVSSVTNDTTLVTTDDVSWSSGDYFVILSKNWQLGAGVESDATYVARSGTDGFKIENCLRKELVAATADSNDPADDPTKTKMYVGKNSTFSSRDIHDGYSGRGWLLLIKQDKVEIAQYSGYIYDYVEGKWYLRAYNEAPDTARCTRNDLTGEWNVGVTFSDVGSITWADNTPALELFPNRFGVTEPLIWIDGIQQGENVGTVVSEGIIQFAQGDAKKDNMKKVRVNQWSYDGDARSANPDKGTDNDAIDITDIAQIATTGLSSTSATNEDIISSSKLMGGAGLIFDTSSSLDTGIYVNKYDYQAFGDTKTGIHPKEIIDKLCDDAGLLYDLRYDDSNEKVIFKPLLQALSPDITLSAGSVASLTREKDVSDVFSAVLVQVSAPQGNYFDPANIIQYGCNFNTSSVPKSNAIPSTFSSGGYSSGSSPPDFFWGRTFLQGLGPDIAPYVEEMPNEDRRIIQSFWRKDSWVDTGRTAYGTPSRKTIYERKYMKRNDSSAEAQASDGSYFPIMTMWFRNSATMKTLDDLQFTLYKASEQGRRNAALRVEVSADVDLTDPLGTGTWQPYNDYARSINFWNDWWSTRIKLSRGGACDVKNVKALRIMGIIAPNAIPGEWAEGRETTRQKSDAERGYQTWGATTTADGTSNTSLAEDFNYSEQLYGYNRTKPLYNYNRQDTCGIFPNTDFWKSWKVNGKQIKSGFENAIAATEEGPSGSGQEGVRAGYIQGSFCLGNFETRGEGTYAMYVRVTKDTATTGSPERLAYSPTYKKIAGLGYKVNPVPLENFSDAEALTIGHRYLDDKLRRYQARDYSLNGASPFVNSNDLPTLGQTIKVVDDGNFTGIMTAFEFSMNSDEARFDFRLEDYDRNKTAKYIQAK